MAKMAYQALRRTGPRLLDAPRRPCGRSAIGFDAPLESLAASSLRLFPHDAASARAPQSLGLFGVISRAVRTTLFIVSAVFSASCTSLTDAVFKAAADSHPPASGALNELVMTPGMSITARTKTGTITVTAGPGLKRTYTWEGASRSATLWPRSERWYGSLGAYYPAPGEPWREHHGITRGVVEEGQQHFDSERAALAWIGEQSGYYPTVYRDDGLVVSFGKVLERRQIDVDVFQLFIRGRKPHRLPGSQNSTIHVSTESDQ